MCHVKISTDFDWAEERCNRALQEKSRILINLENKRFNFQKPKNFFTP